MTSLYVHHLCHCIAILALSISIQAIDRELPVYTPDERAKIAYEYHENAIRLVKEAEETKQYGECLGYFRAAVRLQPDNPTYLTDLGVTEMRIGELQKAKHRFQKALSIDPERLHSKDNLQILKEYMDPVDFDIGEYGVKYPQNQHTLLDPPEVAPIELKLLKADSGYGQDLLAGRYEVVVYCPCFPLSCCLLPLLSVFFLSSFNFYSHIVILVHFIYLLY